MLLEGLNTRDMAEKLQMSDMSNIIPNSSVEVTGDRGRDQSKVYSKQGNDQTRYRSQSSPRTNLTKAEEIKTYVSNMK